MIQTEEQRQVALAAILYYKRSFRAGEQSWLGGEQDREEIMRLRRDVDEYELRIATA